MKKFIKNAFIFLVPALLYSLLSILFVPYLLSLKKGPSTKQQIVYSFDNALSRDYDLLILGNSRTYRGLNPDMFSIKSFNFSHDNDSFNQIYHKLKYLSANKKSIKYLILGLDYFQFSFKSDTRNYIYSDFFEESYMNDFKNSYPFISKAEYLLSNIDFQKWQHILSEENIGTLRENGQYVIHGVAKEDDSIERDINRLDFQKVYFQKVLDFCKENDIKVFMLMLPTRLNELNSYTNSGMDEFNSFINEFIDNKDTYFLNYSRLEGFKTQDYIDITHFNEPAANRFSQMLNKDLLNLY